MSLGVPDSPSRPHDVGTGFPHPHPVRNVAHDYTFADRACPQRRAASAAG